MSSPPAGFFWLCILLALTMRGWVEEVPVEVRQRIPAAFA